MKNSKGQDIKISIPKDTSEIVSKNNGVKEAVGIVIDVIIGMQDKVSKKINK